MGTGNVRPATAHGELATPGTLGTCAPARTVPPLPCFTVAGEASGMAPRNRTRFSRLGIVLYARPI